MSSHIKLSGFTVLQEHYKIVGTHKIRADIIIPNSPIVWKRPVIIRFHGGSFASLQLLVSHQNEIPLQITGDSLIMQWFPQWLLDIAQTSEAIVVSANYRLLPEATGLDIISDIEDLWKSTLTSLPIFSNGSQALQ
jgi:acetyl esterase/lipase